MSPGTVAVKRLACIGLVLVILVGACRRLGGGVAGSGVVKSELRSVEPFSEVVFEGGGHLTLTIGPAQSLSVTADDNILPLMETTVVNRRLHVRPAAPIRPDVVPSVSAVLPDLTYVLLDGAADATVDGLANESLTVEVDGAGQVDLSGRTGSFTVDSKGTGLIDARGLEARAVVVRLTGAGVAHVHATERLDVTINGIGAVTYQGAPTVTKQILGAGSVSQR
jgi:hypothetical protein